MVHTSLSQLQICFEAFRTEPGLVCVLLCATNAHNASDASEIAEGPLKFAEDSNDRIVSVTFECSNRFVSRIELMSLQAALDVTEEENARDVRSTTRGQ